MFNRNPDKVVFLIEYDGISLQKLRAELELPPYVGGIERDTNVRVYELSDIPWAGDFSSFTEFCVIVPKHLEREYREKIDRLKNTPPEKRRELNLPDTPIKVLYNVSVL